MNQILQETKRNQQMSNQIAHRTFITNAFDQGTLPLGQEVSHFMSFVALRTFLLQHFFPENGSSFNLFGSLKQRSL